MTTRSGIVRDIWLHICREGGKWTPDEIAEEFSMSRKKVALTMHNMASRNGSLQRYTQSNRAHFGVTKDCMIPLGISLAELENAVALK